jgi:hypothetical protein
MVLVSGPKYVKVAHFVFSFRVFSAVCVGFMGALFLFGNLWAVFGIHCSLVSHL